MNGEPVGRMSLKERLYLPPIQKYKKYRFFPWEIIVSILLIILTTCQVILVVQMSSTYSYSQVMMWNKMFLNLDVRGRQVAGKDTMITNSYNLYYLDYLSEYVKKLVDVSYHPAVLQHQQLHIRRLRILLDRRVKDPPPPAHPVHQRR